MGRYSHDAFERLIAQKDTLYYRHNLSNVFMGNVIKLCLKHNPFVILEQSVIHKTLRTLRNSL